MKKDNLILIGLLVVIVFLAVLCGYFAFQKQDLSQKEKTDALKIKEEYEAFNDTVNENNKKNYPEVHLSEENPFVYKSEEEIVNILENGTGIIYFGFAKCPWCRTLLPVLDEAAKELNIGEIYYLDILNIRSVLSLDENNKIITEKEGTSNYYKILDLLQDQLRDYTLTTKEGKKVNTNEKRLYAPTVVAVSNGQIKGFHEATLPSQKTGYEILTEKEKGELKTILVDLLKSVSIGVCDEGC